VLKDTYTQVQEIRTYYSFNDVDVDRYVVNGEYRMVLASARELKWKPCRLRHNRGSTCI
jgi:uncharacterized membrane protein (UPF0182 family)